MGRRRKPNWSVRGEIGTGVLITVYSDCVNLEIREEFDGAWLTPWGAGHLGRVLLQAAEALAVTKKRRSRHG